MPAASKRTEGRYSSRQLADYDRIWQTSRQTWYFPHMPKARYVEDPASEKGLDDGIREKLQHEIGFATLKDMQIYISIPNCIKHLGNASNQRNLERFVKGVTEHEVGHYSLHPYNYTNYLILTDYAARGLENSSAFRNGGKLEHDKYAMAGQLCNLLSDTIINTHLVDRNDKNIPFVYDCMQKEKSAEGSDKGKIWNIYMRTYEKLWNMDGRFVPKGRIKKDVERASDEILKMFNGCNMYASRNYEWMAYTYATIMAPYAKAEPKDLKQSSESSEGNPSGRESKSRKGQQQKNGNGKGQEGEGDGKDAQEGKNGGSETEKEKERQKSRDQFKGVARKLKDKQRYKDLRAGVGDPGAGDTNNEADRAYYKDIADDYTIKYAPSRTKKSQNYPYSPKKWTPSDPTDDLDILYSTATGGKLIPGVTTYKWQKHGDDRVKNDAGPPDLLLMLDSSGSMTDPIGSTSMAVLSSYVAAYSALNLGAKVAVINFSDKRYVQDFTNDPMKIEDILVKYQQGGTTMPTTEIGELVKKNPNPVQMLLISDAQIYNANEGFKSFIDALKCNPANRGAVFLIEDAGKPTNDKTDVLKSAGVEFFDVEKEEDLFNLVVGKTQAVYGGDSGG